MTIETKRTRSRRGEGEKLRGDILDAAERLLLETDNAEAVSVRAVAQAVGVTSPAIYLHFDDKDALILAVCERSFERFDAYMAEAAIGTNDPIEDLRARGRAYVRFGLENPEPYRFLFMRRDLEPSWDPASMPLDTMPGIQCFTNLVEAVQRAIDAGQFAGVDAWLMATGIWATVHGLTSLLITHGSFPWPTIDALIDHVIDATIRGLSAPA